MGSGKHTQRHADRSRLKPHSSTVRHLLLRGEWLGHLGRTRNSDSVEAEAVLSPPTAHQACRLPHCCIRGHDMLSWRLLWSSAVAAGCKTTMQGEAAAERTSFCSRATPGHALWECATASNQGVNVPLQTVDNVREVRARGDEHQLVQPGIVRCCMRQMCSLICSLTGLFAIVGKSKHMHVE